MNKLFNTIRAKLILSYGAFIMILVIIIGTSLWFESKQADLLQLSQELEEANNNLNEADRILASFLVDETINPQFYETQRSSYLSQWKNKTEYSLERLQDFKKEVKNLGLEIPLPVEIIQMNIEELESDFQQLIQKVLKRGFQDYGLEGEMRNYIHAIEEIEFIDKALMLTCRRHEKDFFLRKQEKYIERLKNAAEVLKLDVLKKTSNGSYQDSLALLIDKYRETFEDIVLLEKEIGFDGQKGVRGDIFYKNQQLEKQLKEVEKFTNEKIVSLRYNAQNILFAVIIGGLVVSLFLAFFIPQVLGKPVRTLSRSINNVIAKDFADNVHVEKVHTQDEIGKLSRDFSVMLGRMQYLLKELKKNAETTEKKQQLLLDSIRYARQIQGAILPSDELISHFFPAYFLIYKPLHIVSGDFFWVTRKHNRVYVAVADCTGHGVPGAFMSMIGHTLLNKILNQDNIFEPAAILEVLHIEIKEALRQDENKNTGDGMDIGLFAMEYLPDKPQDRLITFSSAKVPLFYTENESFNVIKATRRSIGGGTKRQEEKLFESHVITLTQGDYIYMATDGFADQNNLERKKFGKKKLQKELNKYIHLPLKEQQKRLEYALENHQKQALQRDDITLLGLSL